MTLSSVSDDYPEATAQRPAIEVQDLSISYRVRVGRGSIVGDLAKSLTGRHQPDRVVPAVRNLTFDIPRGETFAIIGRNGAGKSTLLRALSGALAPTRGRIVVRGRVNLLAIGIGMNPKLTGRQNITLGGLAVGLSRRRLTELTDEIADFAQLGEYLDFPMSTYSTGMRTRLAFAVAVHLDPDILLVDEALGGGDAGFKQHAQQKMAELMRGGRTIVLVSHGLTSVRSMATSAMWMHQGTLAAAGDPDDVVAQYMRYCRIEDLDLLDED